MPDCGGFRISSCFIARPLPILTLIDSNCYNTPNQEEPVVKGDCAMTDEFVTVGEARDLLGISKPKMTQLLREGILTATTSPLDKRVKLVRAADVEILLAQWRKKRSGIDKAAAR
jgi:hypothetical protein